MKNKEAISWKKSITLKHLILFGFVILFIVIVTSLLHFGAINVARQSAYDNMDAKAGYYLQMIEAELSHVRSVQLNFFNDRKLVYLSDPKVNISMYEKREALLSVRDRITSIDGISNMLGEIILYLPRSGYKITSSSIDTMESEDQSRYEEYYGEQKGRLIETEDSFILLENGTGSAKIDDGTLYLLVLNFPKHKLMEGIETNVDEEQEGAFFYSDKYGVVTGDEDKSMVAEEIIKQMSTNMDGINTKTRLVMLENERYLVSVNKSQMLGRFIQYAKEKPLMMDITKYRNYMYIVWGMTGILAVVFVFYTQKMIRKPIDRLLEAFAVMKNGNFKEHIYHENEDEFSYLFTGYNEMIDQLDHLVNEVLVQKNLIQKVELKQLQAQINPHFLYNSFFVLSRRVKRHDYENAEKFAVLLGNYFRFLTRSGSDFIELQQEVEHARCYANIQGTRFADRIAVMFQQLPAEYEDVLVPRLILQPLLENSFEYGLEDKDMDGRMEVSFAEEKDNFVINVEDNGDKATPELIVRMQESLLGKDDGEITGIINIHKRLGIYFEGNAGLRVTKSNLGGICIGIWLKRKEKNE